MYNVEFIICPAYVIRLGVQNILFTELPTEANISVNMARFTPPQKKYRDVWLVSSYVKQVAIRLSKTEFKEDTDTLPFTNWKTEKKEQKKGIWIHFNM